MLILINHKSLILILKKNKNNYEQVLLATWANPNYSRGAKSLPLTWEWRMKVLMPRRFGTRIFLKWYMESQHKHWTHVWFHSKFRVNNTKRTTGTIINSIISWDMKYHLGTWNKAFQKGKIKSGKGIMIGAQIMLDFLFTAHTNMDNFPINEIQEFNNAKMQQAVKRIKTLNSTK